jgi:hypothetical protein
LGNLWNIGHDLTLSGWWNFNHSVAWQFPWPKNKPWDDSCLPNNLGDKKKLPRNCGGASRSPDDLLTIVEYHSEVAIGPAQG